MESHSCELGFSCKAETAKVDASNEVVYPMIKKGILKNINYIINLYKFIIFNLYFII